MRARVRPVTRAKEKICDDVRPAVTSDHLAWALQNISIRPLSAGRVLDGEVVTKEGRFRCKR